MTGRLVSLQQGSAEWLRWRRGVVTATDTASVLAGGRFVKTIAQVAEAKRTESESPKTPAMRFGNAIEPYARSWGERQTGVLFRPTCLVHSEHDWLAASLDGLADDSGGSSDRLILEIKSGKWDAEHVARGVVPPYTAYQIQHQLLVAGLSHAVLVTFPGYPEPLAERLAAMAAVKLAGGVAPDTHVGPRWMRLTADPAVQTRILETAAAIRSKMTT